MSIEEEYKEELSVAHDESLSSSESSEIKPTAQGTSDIKFGENNGKSTADYVEDIGADLEVWDVDENGKPYKKQLDGILHKDGRREIRERNCYDKLGYSFPWWRKWMILSVVFICQVSMNFNAGFYSGGLSLIEEAFHISAPKARVSQMLMLVLYAFGCELWAPWSEEYGRWGVLQASLFFVNIWQILGALAPNFGAICVARAFTGLFSAGGSVTLAIVADMWEPNDQGFAVLFVVASSVGGSTLAPIFAGIATDNLSWHWNFWIQLIVGGFAQALHFFLVTETRSSVLMDREAKRRRKTGEDTNIYGPTEIHGSRLSVKFALEVWKRPFVMFLTEPIVLCLSLMSGFSDMLIFLFMSSIGLVFSQWGFGNTASGLVYVAVLVGYIIAYGFHFIDVGRQIHVMRKHGDESRFAERRLLLLLFLAPLEPIGLFIFAWTSLGPDYGIPWIAPAIGFALIGIANFSIYMATIDYMIMAYGPYSASATGGNGFARDFLSGIGILFAVPLYENMGTLHYEWASTLLAFISILVIIPIYIFYWKGPMIRRKSKFAQTLAADRKLEKMPNEEYFSTEHEPVP
nr:MFS.5 [Starmerella bombicola]